MQQNENKVAYNTKIRLIADIIKLIAFKLIFYNIRR